MKLKYKDLVDLQHELHSEYQASFMQLAKFIKLEDELSKPIGDDESYQKLLKDKESLIEPWLQVNLFEHFKADVVLKKREESQATNLFALHCPQLLQEEVCERIFLHQYQVLAF